MSDGPQWLVKIRHASGGYAKRFKAMDQTLKKQFVVFGGIAFVLIYFCVLRGKDEVDVEDPMLMKLKRLYISNQKQNRSNEGIENLLKQLKVSVSDLEKVK